MKKLKTLVCSAIMLALAAVSFNGCTQDGTDGKDGTSIVWKGSLESAPSNPQYMWAYYDTTKQCSYVWNGTAWTLLAGSEQTTFPVTILKSPDFTTKSVTFRAISNGQPADVGDPLVFGFKNDLPEVPYVLCSATILNDLTGTQYKVSEITADTTQVTLTNPKGDTAVFDLTTRTCAFKNYDAFFQDSVEQGEDKQEILLYNNAASPLMDYLWINDHSNIPGQEIAIDWSSQDVGIALAQLSDETYVLAIPLQTFDDFFGCGFIYNGEKIYYASLLRGSNTDYIDEYYSAGPKPARSQAFADYCYNELCLNFDINYGLKALHGIGDFPDFDTYFSCVGVKENLKSTDPFTFAKGVKDVCEFYFDDGHSDYTRNSYYLRKDQDIPATHTASMDKAYFAAQAKYIAARNEVYKDNDWANSAGTRRKASGYEVTADGKTAIVRFDSFTCNGKKAAELIEDRNKLLEDNHALLNTYAGCYEDSYDTSAFISAVNELIQNDSKIENVVLDVSRNGGGAVQAGAVVVSWMLGEVTFNMTNPITGAKYNIVYEADVNLDGTYDATTSETADEARKDTIKRKNLFCLISPVSFSCGNSVPAMLKASGNVTIIGVTSGGGAAFVHYTSAADGTLFRCSSKYVAGTSKNGSIYNIDQGVEPDYRINKPANFYDKAYIETLVNNINSGKASTNN